MRIGFVSLTDGFSPSKVVRDPTPVIDKTGQFSPEGVFSERIFGRMPSSGREYSCNCGGMAVRTYEGMTCPKCNTEVVCRDTLFNKRGWIDLAPYSIISPLFFVYFSKVVGPSQLTKILQQKRVLNANGIAKQNAKGDIFDNMGLIEFASRWPEVLEYYEEKRASTPGVSEYARVIRENPDMVMTTAFPIFNHILRPALVVDRKIIFNEINNVFNIMVNNAKTLSELTEIEKSDASINSILWRIQEKSNEVLKHVLRVLSGKAGYLRGNMLGTRINWSGRFVIIPLEAGHEQDEIQIPYIGFLELYRFQITNVLAKMNGITTAEANDIWCKAQVEFDPAVYEIMQEMIRKSKDGGMYALINRNPSISFGSILRCRITGVKLPNDYTMSVHNGILALLGGDYDGGHCRL